MEKKLIILGQPVTWKRPGGFSQRYDEQQHSKFSVGIEVKNQLGKLPVFKTALQLTFNFYFMVPKKGGTKLQEQLRGKPMLKRRDLDNLIKFYLDALNGVVWYDDSLITSIIAHKLYDDPERTEITILEL